MSSFEGINVVADVVFGVAMIIFGFAGGLFVAACVWRKSMETRVSRKDAKAQAKLWDDVEVIPTKFKNT